MQPSPIAAAVQAYAAMQPALRRATGEYVDLVTGLLDDAGINYLSVTGRTKSVASFADKATRTPDGSAAYDDPLEEITDQIGVRVITYVHSDVAAVADLLAGEFTILDDRDLGAENARQGRWGYSSRHVLLTPDADDPEDPDDSAAYSGLRGLRASVQIRTVLQHAWAEFEHDIRYKGTIPDEHATDLDRRFTLAAGLLELADREFSKIRDRIRTSVVDERSPADDEDPRIDAKELATFLAGIFPDAEWSRADHYGWISGLLLELGIVSLDELQGLLSTIDRAAINERMGYKYPPGVVRRLDDVLLAVFGARYVGLHGNAHRTGLLADRLEKIRP
ncbi:(p)ppGpp synthetase [Nocardioides sp. AE5]|uniref:GTP pyrophosphokinase n=1 Tax=Nocardioides sp. AE5 TaxID=2962573 RepID=UPI0028816F89|nr:(p)ppGpp synthetase [Nocardioides sp. AE5]MDT0202995.1 (p)ppGpp synthetase [Nocardioides sp. AE5]